MSMQTINLTQVSWKIPATVHGVQGDTGRTLRMIIDDVTVNSNMSGSLAFERSDGTHYEVAATTEVGTNSFSANIAQALTQTGETHCQLKITDSNGIVSTYMFIIEAQESTDGTPTEQEGWTIKDAVDKANDAYEAATAALEAAQDAITELAQIYAGVVVDITADGTIEIGEIEEES